MSYQSVVLADSPGFLYLLNEASGNFTDLTANANTGVAHGSITYGVASGFAGQPKAITLGAAGYIAAPHNAANNIISTTLSWEFAFGYSGSVAAQPFIMAKGQNAANGGYGVFIANTGTLGIFATSSGLVIDTGFSPTLDGTVRHYILCRNGGAASTTLYVNSVSQTLSTGTGAGTIGTQTAEYDLGAAFTTGTGVVELFTGAKMCCMSVFPAVLNQTQVTAHYNALTTAATSAASIKKSPPPAIAARARKQLRKSPLGHLDDVRLKGEDQ